MTMVRRIRPSRRRLILAGASTLAAAGTAPMVIGSARASQKTLRIMQWDHFVPAFDEWFNNKFVVEWGRRNNTQVVVSNVGMTSLPGRAAAEIARRRGHDICMFLSPPASYEDHVIDHRDVYAECERRYGKPLDIAVKSTFNPRSGKYFGFSDSFVPDPINYRKDLWDDVGIVPDSWDNIRRGGARIKQKHAIPVGLGLARELDTSMALRSMLLAFGGSEQTADGVPNIRNAATLEALKFAKALYEDTMTEEVFSWDASSNNRLMLAGRGSLTLNAISITRTGEAMKSPIAEKIHLMKPARGPGARLGMMHLMNAYVVWNHSENIDGAKRFLVDLVGESRNAFLASEFYNFPTFPQLVPDLKDLIANDPKAKPADKYAIFADAAEWTVNVGYPGFANAAIDEIFNEWLIPRMFAEVAAGRATPQEAMSTYGAQCDRIYEKWRTGGKV